MKSKTLFFKDIKQFWPFWIFPLFAYGFLLLSLNTSLSSPLKHYLGKEDVLSEQQVATDSLAHLVSNPLILAALALPFALIVFSYLNKTRHAYMMATFPISRTKMFFSHYLSGLTLLMVPYLLLQGGIFLIANHYKVGMNSLLLGLLIFSVINLFLYYNLAVAAAVFSGGYIMSSVIYLVLQLLAGFIYYCIGIYGEILSVVGIRCTTDNIFYSKFSSLSPVIKLYITHSMLEANEIETAYTCNWDKLTPCLWYLIPAFLLIFLGWQMYRKRPLETAKEFVAFSWAKPLFRVIFSFCGGILLTIVFITITVNGEDDSPSAAYLYIITAFFGVLCFILSEILLKKTIRVFQNFPWKQGIVAVVLLLLFPISISQGLFSYKVPKNANNIVYLRIQASNISDTITIKNADGIQSFIDYQKGLENSQSGDDISFQYIMKSGETRTFTLPNNEKEFQQVLEDYIDTCDQTMLETLVFQNPLKLKYLSGISIPDENGGYCDCSSNILSEEEFELYRESLYQALKDKKVSIFADESLSWVCLDYLDPTTLTNHNEPLLYSKYLYIRDEDCEFARLSREYCERMQEIDEGEIIYD